MRGSWLFLAIVLATGATLAAAERPLFETGSEHVERPRQQHVRPAPALVHVILASLDRFLIPVLDTCLAEHHRAPGDYSSLLSAIRIPAGRGRVLWFVRAPVDQYCDALYGAHGFHFYLVEERVIGAGPRYRLLLTDLVDRLAVYRRMHHGLNDVEGTSCTAGDCGTARLAYDGVRYRSVRCTSTMFSGRREVTRPARCPRTD